MLATQLPEFNGASPLRPWVLTREFLRWKYDQDQEGGIVICVTSAIALIRLSAIVGTRVGEGKVWRHRGDAVSILGRPQDQQLDL